MEDEAQKMVELKKAFADVILNIAKEAATRVMVSERNALRFQQDLCSVNDEALRMLLRLKNMINSKMKETEITSLCQRRKIEELEAQLQEAEDVITDLRIQLKEARYQLEKEKNDRIQPSEGKIMNKITFSSKSIIERNPFCCSTSESQTVSSDLTNMKVQQVAPNVTRYNVTNPIEHSAVSQVDIVYSHDSELASTVAGTTEHELYKNSCNQRIRALEGNFLDCKLPRAIGAKDEQVLLENEPLARKRDKEERGLSTRTGMKDIRKNVHAAEIKRSVKFHIVRRKFGFGKYKTGSDRLHGRQLMKSRQPLSIISPCRSYLRDGNVRSNRNEFMIPSLMADSGNVTETSSMVEEHKSDSYNDENIIFHGGKIKGTMKRGNLNGCSLDQLTDPFNKSVVPSPCRTSINLVSNIVKSGEDHSNMTEHENQMRQSNQVDPRLALTSNVDSMSVCTGVTASVDIINRSKVLENASNSERELMALTVKQESDSICNLIFQSSHLNSEMNTNTRYEKILGVRSSSPCQVEKKTILRCTLQRKRKKEAMGISDENLSPEKSNGKRRLEEKLKSECEFERSDLLIKSSRENQLLSQVAHQLMSLSGKG